MMAVMSLIQKYVRPHLKLFLPSSAQAPASIPAWGWGHNTALLPKVKLFNLTSRAHKWIMTLTLSAKRSKFSVSKFSNSEFSVSKFSNSEFLNFQLPNFQIPNFQISNFQIPNFQIPNFQIPNFQILHFQMLNFTEIHREYYKKLSFSFRINLSYAL